MSYIVSIHPAAEQDFDEQFDYIAQRSYEGALRWEIAFESLQLRLATNPLQYAEALEEPWLKRGLRSAPFKTPQGNTYVAIYTVTENRVMIVRVRGQGEPPLTQNDLPNG